jgi:hypothetical protein
LKRKVLAILLCLGIFASQTAFSQDYNVLIYPQNAQISSYIQAFFTSKPADSLSKTDISQVSYEKELKANGEALTKAYATEDKSKIEAAQEKYSSTELQTLDEAESFDVKIVSFSDSSIDIANVISDNDLLTFDYIASSSNANLIIMPVSEQLSGFTLQSIYVYNRAEKSVKLIFEELTQTGSSYSLNGLLALAKLFDESKTAVLTFDGLVQGSQVLVDGVEVSLYEDTCILTAGTHTFDISLNGYETKHLRSQLQANTVSTMYVEMEPIVYNNLLVESNVAADVSIDGNLVGSTPYTLTSYSLPLILNLSSDGYVDKTISLNEQKSSISITLKPEWMNDQEKYENSKNKFYNSFARSLLIFGLKIVSQSFDINKTGFWNAADILCTGALYLSLTDLAGNLIDYYRYSEYISP